MSVSASFSEPAVWGCTARHRVRERPGRVVMVVWCGECRTSSLAQTSVTRAPHAAVSHDRAHGHSNPTAKVLLAPMCESCRLAGGVGLWPHPDAGVPFILCAGCAPRDGLVGRCSW
jgi:hypothetical protein